MDSSTQSSIAATQPPPFQFGISDNNPTSLRSPQQIDTSAAQNQQPIASFNIGQHVTASNYASQYFVASNQMSQQASTANVSSTTSPVLLDFNSVRSLTIPELKRECKQHDISTDVSKLAMVNLLCQALNISTIGLSQGSALPFIDTNLVSKGHVNELEKLTPLHIHRLKGWSKSTDNIPIITDKDVKQYLLKTSVIAQENERSYKLSRPYMLMENIHSCEMLRHGSFILVRGQCNPSQSTSKDDVKYMHVVLDFDGNPVGGFCVCTAGQGQSCGHVGALLFCLAEIVAAGKKHLPDHLGVTEKPCYWLKPKGPTVEPKVISDIDIKKVANPKRLPPTDNNLKKPNLNSILRLRGRLLEASRRIGNDIPATHLLQPKRFKEEKDYKPVVALSLGDSFSWLSPEIAISNEVTVITTPIQIMRFPEVNSTESTSDPNYNSKYDSFFKTMASYTQTDLNSIETLTRGQSENIAWFDYKRGAISASRAHSIVSFMNKGKSNSDRLILESVRYDRENMSCIPPIKVAALKYGIQNENNAISQFVKFSEMELNPFRHISLQIERKGIISDAERPYFQCSPDLIVDCECHGQRLVEVKCPYNARDMTIREAIESKKISYLKQNTNTKKFELVKGSDGYYCQIQMALAITKLKSCVFLVWSNYELLETEVPFNAEFWENEMEPLLDGFYRKFVVPEIITGCLKRSDKAKVNDTSASNIDVEQTPQLVDDQNVQATVEIVTDSKCYVCKAVLLHEPKFVKDFSVGCECATCQPECETWIHWRCCKPKFTKKHSENGRKWFCETCKNH